MHKKVLARKILTNTKSCRTEIMKNKVNNWKTPVYEKEEDYDNPAGDIFRELKSDDLIK